MFALDLSRYEQSRYKWLRSVLHVVMYVLKYILLFPFFAFFWFAVITAILAFLAKDQSFSQVLLMGLATVGTIRVAAYVKEDLSRDLAKMLPFAVLGIFLVNTSFFQIEDSLALLDETINYTENILYYLLYLIALEFALRMIMGIVVFLIAIGKRILLIQPPEAKPGPDDTPPPDDDDAAETLGDGEERRGDGARTALRSPFGKVVRFRGPVGEQGSTCLLPSSPRTPMRGGTHATFVIPSVAEESETSAPQTHPTDRQPTSSWNSGKTRYPHPLRLARRHPSVFPDSDRGSTCRTRSGTPRWGTGAVSAVTAERRGRVSNPPLRKGWRVEGAASEGTGCPR